MEAKQCLQEQDYILLKKKHVASSKIKLIVINLRQVF